MYRLSFPGKQGGGFSHEIHAAQDDVRRVNVRHAAGKFQRVAGNVAMGDNRVVLVMMPHDAEIPSQFLSDGVNGIGGDVHAGNSLKQMEVTEKGDGRQPVFTEPESC
jgi:hypothetical protein